MQAKKMWHVTRYRPVLNALLTGSLDVSHPSGHGNLVIYPCEVEIDILIPEDLKATPYYLFTSRGVHTHPPPPPHRTPEAVTKEIAALVQRMSNPTLTLGMLCSERVVNRLLICSQY